ncbi:hypothetical protein TIFTF001_044105, partial [Ficus carica]
MKIHDFHHRDSQFSSRIKIHDFYRWDSQFSSSIVVATVLATGVDRQAYSSGREGRKKEERERRGVPESASLLVLPPRKHACSLLPGYSTTSASQQIIGIAIGRGRVDMLPSSPYPPLFLPPYPPLYPPNLIPVHMEGFGVHTFTIINKACKTTFVKFHWKPTCGVKSLLEEDAIRVGGTNHSHATQDLYESIDAGNNPEWKLYIQTVDPADEPAHVVPGIHYLDDKMLQARLFAYGDAQRYRLGIDYFPSCRDPVHHAERFPLLDHPIINGRRERCTMLKEDNFTQAGIRYRSCKPDRYFLHVGPCYSLEKKIKMFDLICMTDSRDDRLMSWLTTVSSLISAKSGFPILLRISYFAQDSKIQEHAVSALLNLSIDDANKRNIAREGAIPAKIEVLQKRNIEARENSAAALFSLFIIDENKMIVKLSNGIPPLVELLQNGTIQGKKDAATAPFNLSLNQANRTRAIGAGIVAPLLQLLKDRNLGMIDEALSILLLIAAHPDGRQEIGQLSFIECLVEFIREGTPKNKECAASV